LLQAGRSTYFNAMSTFQMTITQTSAQIKNELDLIHASAERIAKDKQAAIRFLHSTGMYDKKGKIKKRFR